MTRELSLGISPCPNDTFMFHDLVHGIAPVEGVAWRTDLLDIEALNLHALADPPRFDVTKLSLPAFARRAGHYSILESGAALGRGCGPLVVCPRADARTTLAGLADRVVAVPGENTTALLLLRIFAPRGFTPRVMRFDEIMPAVASGAADAGLVIHESRFTFARHGLREVLDLGVAWEEATGLPLPLGVIAARRSLDDELFAGIGEALRRSVEGAFADRSRSRAWIREHAQEMDEAVCRAHIDLYVNEFSIELGDEGRRAIEELLRRGREHGALPEGGSAVGTADGEAGGGTDAGADAESATGGGADGGGTAGGAAATISPWR